MPITAEEHIEELLPVPPMMLPTGGPFFALKVRDDSMNGHGAGQTSPWEVTVDLADFEHLVREILDSAG